MLDSFNDLFLEVFQPDLVLVRFSYFCIFSHPVFYTVAVTGVQAASFPFVLITLLLDIVQILRQHQPDKVYIDDQLLP